MIYIILACQLLSQNSKIFITIVHIDDFFQCISNKLLVFPMFKVRNNFFYTFLFISDLTNHMNQGIPHPGSFIMLQFCPPEVLSHDRSPCGSLYPHDANIVLPSLKQAPDLPRPFS